MLSLILSLSILSQAAAECTRSTLQQAAEGYLASVTSGKLTIPVTDTVEYTENFKKADLATGFHTNKVTVDLHRHLLDTTACATFTEIIAPNNTTPYVAGIQIRYAPDGKASKIEAIVTKNGTGHLFDAKDTYEWAIREKRAPIPEAARDSRAVLQGVADTYLERFTDGRDVPRHAVCERLEGSKHVSPNCIVGMNSNAARKMSDRRYVIDETVGSVNVLLAFDGLPDSHEFLIEGGKLRIVHIMTAGVLKLALPKGINITIADFDKLPATRI